MTCIAPSNELFVENKFFQMNHPWVRKHYIEESSSDEEGHHAHVPRDQPLDRLKEINALLHSEAAYAQRYSEQPMTPNNRKRLFSEYNTSPDFRHAPEYQDDGRYKLTLSQFATSASEQEPLYPGDDEDVEEILMRLRHGNDFYKPKMAQPTTLPSILFSPNHMSRPHFHHHDQFVPSPPLAPSPPTNKASLFHILSQEPENVNSMSHHSHPHPHHHSHSHHSHHSHPHHMSVHNNLHMRKMFFDDGMLESSDEMGLEHPKKKARRDNKPKSPLKSIIVSNDDVQEKETVAAGLCFKTHKPKVQREYYYAKLSKTIFRWTCCGSQAKTHPDA